MIKFYAKYFPILTFIWLVLSLILFFNVMLEDLEVSKTKMLCRLLRDVVLSGVIINGLGLLARHYSKK